MDSWPMIEQCMLHQGDGFSFSERAALGLIAPDEAEYRGNSYLALVADEGIVEGFHPIDNAEDYIAED